MKKRTFSEERRATYCSEHQVVLDALLARDSEGASNAMLTLLRTVEAIFWGGNRPDGGPRVDIA
jgi:DNA-binding FadR family transcriptional regulator